MNTLTVDIGNTNVKIMVWNEGGLVEQIISHDLEVDDIKRIIEAYKINHGAISSVRGNIDELKEIFEGLLKGFVLVLDSRKDEYFRQHTDYHMPIGNDRIAAYYGAECLFPGKAKLIVDCGTAMTLDYVLSNGWHKGGDISLGYNSRLDAISKKTALLPRVAAEIEKGPAFGGDTKEAILNGVFHGMTGEILYAVERTGESVSKIKILLTGGDSEKFLETLKKKGLDVYYDPYLVGRGLDKILRSMLAVQN